MTALADVTASCPNKRKASPELGGPLGTPEVFSLKRLRLDETAPASLATQLAGHLSGAAYGQPPAPALPPSSSAPVYPTRGQPATRPQQTLRTIPEIHIEMEPHLHQQGPNSPPTPQQLWGTPQQQQPTQQQQPAQQQPRAQQRAPAALWPGRQQHTAQPTVSHLGKHSRSAMDEEEDGGLPSSSSSSEDEAGHGPPAVAEQPPLHRRRVGEDGVRLLVPQHLTAIPSVLLDPAGQGALPGVPPDGRLGFTGAAAGPAGPAGDCMAVVPYVPPGEVVQEACRRAVLGRRPASPLEEWCHQSGLMFDNERPLPEVPPRPGSAGVVIEELGGGEEAPEGMAGAGAEAMDADTPDAMEE